MKEYLSKPENRKFVESDKHAKPVICVETGEYYSSQSAVEVTTGYGGIHGVCQGKNTLPEVITGGMRRRRKSLHKKSCRSENGNKK